MLQYKIINDRIDNLGEVPYLGVPYDDIKNGKVATLPENYDGWFPFTRMCLSIGDFGIISGIFGALKVKYPNIKIAVPSREYLQQFFDTDAVHWRYKETDPLANQDLIYRNNPYIDYRFNAGEFDAVFCDHDRSYTSLVHDGEMVRSCDEPLAEQILRRFGFTEEDILTIDSKPKLFFSPEEIEAGDSIIKTYIGDANYGCLLFASRLATFDSRWDFDSYLLDEAQKYQNIPCFYYSSFDIKNTEWGSVFPELYSFTELNVPLRIQMYIKTKATFNIGYQAGITDACSGAGSEVITLCPYRSIRENCIRGVKYVYSDGTVKQF